MEHEDLADVEELADGGEQNEGADRGTAALRRPIDELAEAGGELSKFRLEESTKNEHKSIQQRYISFVRGGGVPDYEPGPPSIDQMNYIMAYLVHLWLELALKFNTIVKHRSAISKLFGDLFDVTAMRFYKDPSGRWFGNPALSDTIADLMVAIKKDKASTGDRQQSMRAILHFDLERIWNYLFATTRCQGLRHPGRF